MSNDELVTKVATLENEIKWLKWIIPGACGFVSLLILIFWNVETGKIGERVSQALNEAGFEKANDEIEAARIASIASRDVILQTEQNAQATLKALSENARVIKIQVLSTDFVKDGTPDTSGEFFNFSVQAVDEALGSPGVDTWHGQKVFGFNVRTGRSGPIVIWGVDGGSLRDQDVWGDGTGRFDDAATGELHFAPNDTLIAIAPN